MQVMAEMETPIPVPWPNWEAKGYLPALMPAEWSRSDLTRDHVITVNPDGLIETSTPSVNPLQPDTSVEDANQAKQQAAAVSAKAKLKSLGFSDEEMGALGINGK